MPTGEIGLFGPITFNVEDNVTECEICKELNKEDNRIFITEIKITGYGGGYYNWGCEINYCPKCGKQLERRIRNESTD